MKKVEHDLPRFRVVAYVAEGVGAACRRRDPGGRRHTRATPCEPRIPALPEGPCDIWRSAVT